MSFLVNTQLDLTGLDLELSPGVLSRGDPIGTALFSPDRRYRYLLSREWEVDNTGGVCVFIGLNPSKAGATDADPTVRRMVNFARSWGYAAMVVLNKYAYISTSPKGLREKGLSDPIGPDNDRILFKFCQAHSSTVVACWGSNPDPVNGRTENLLKKLRKKQVRIYCLGYTNRGDPRHPLYLPENTTLIRYGSN
jgi:hypothetical protein